MNELPTLQHWHARPPHLVVEVSDEHWGKLGYVVIDRSVHDTASGGVRFAPDVSVEELTSLARAMTYKWALLNVPMGGAKAGITATQPLGGDRAALMEAFGRAIAALVRQRVYSPGIDLGTTLDDLRAIMRGAGRPLPEEQIDGSQCTALTVFETIRQVMIFHGRPLAGLRVALEGFGKVASGVADSLAQAGAIVVALSTVEGAIQKDDGLDVARLLALKQAHGDRLVAHYPEAQTIAGEALFTLPVDLVVPGARPWVIRADNSPQIQARFIVPISNAPVTPDAESLLTERGLIVIPDFLANCGGILASAMLSHGFNLSDARWVVEGVFAEVVIGILKRARSSGERIGDTARAVAWARHLALNEPAAVHTSRLERAGRLWREQSFGGVWRRLAWRAHQRWPHLSDAVQHAALDRFAEMSLGVTLAQIPTEAAGTHHA